MKITDIPKNGFELLSYFLSYVPSIFKCQINLMKLELILDSLRRVKMDQRKLEENQSTLVDMAKVKSFCFF